MSEAVTVPRLMMMTLIVSEELLAREIHTDRHTYTDRQTAVSSMLTFSKSLKTLKTKRQNKCHGDNFYLSGGHVEETHQAVQAPCGKVGVVRRHCHTGHGLKTQRCQ